MQVVQFQRRQPPARFSIEGYFSRVREHLQQKTEVRVHIAPRFSQGLRGRLRNLLDARRNQGDVNHVTGDINYVAIALHPRRTVLTVLDCEILHRLSGWKRALVRLLWYTLPCRRITAMTVISEETKRQVLKEVRFPEDRIYVIPVSVSPLYVPSPQPFNAERPRILQIGTKANKNLLRLAEALRDLPCDLDIIGPLTDEQQSALQAAGINYQNYQQITDEEMVERYQQADIISFVSTHEGFGMPIVEAQSVERVCVTSNCSSMPEVAGQGACLVDPFDVASIREGFLKVIRDADFRESLIAHGRENKLRFSADRIADQFLELYQSIHREAAS